jgi:hypothetical protein
MTEKLFKTGHHQMAFAIITRGFARRERGPFHQGSMGRVTIRREITRSIPAATHHIRPSGAAGLIGVHPGATAGDQQEQENCQASDALPIHQLISFFSVSFRCWASSILSKNTSHSMLLTSTAFYMVVLSSSSRSFLSSWEYDFIIYCFLGFGRALGTASERRYGDV